MARFPHGPRRMRPHDPGRRNTDRLKTVHCAAFAASAAGAGKNWNAASWRLSVHDQSGSFFKTTHWSIVIAATADSKLLEDLLARYWGPIYAYIRRSGYPREQAADLAQEFVAQVVLERGLIERADPERGRFRTFIKSALRNFLIDQHRRSTARGRAPAGGAPVITGMDLEDLEPAEHEEPASAFDRQWATTLLDLALKRVEQDCAASGQEVHWAAFKSAIIDPAVRHSTPARLEDLAAQLGVSSADRISSMIQTVRRKFKRVLRDVVAETLAEPGHTEDELNELRRFLTL